MRKSWTILPLNRVACLGAAALVVVTACSSSNLSGNEFGRSAGGAGTASATGTGGGASGSLGFGGSSTMEGGAAAFDGAGIDGAPCGQSNIEASAKQVNILLVIDRSGSMTPAPPALDKWSALKMALPLALEPVKGGISFGLMLFPNNLATPIPAACTSECWDMPAGESAVVVPVGAGATTLPAIITKLNDKPSGGTPTYEALKQAREYFVSGGGKDLPGEKYVLLATDGGPNGGSAGCQQETCTVNMDRNEFGVDKPNYCNPSLVPDGLRSCLDDTRTVAEIAAMAAGGVKTFVIGIPGTEPYVPTLDAMAAAGGVPASTTSPKYFQVSGAGVVAGIQQVFESITRGLIKTCRQQLQSNPPVPGLLNVYVDNQVVGYRPDGGVDGWYLDSSTQPATVVLTGAVCSKVETTGASSVKVVYGCPTTIVN